MKDFFEKNWNNWSKSLNYILDKGVFSRQVIQKIDWNKLGFASATSKQKNIKENLEKYKREKGNTSIVFE